ncbi:MAG: type II toxin-antitoxin system mRNA interferase toxin, RelE/StbE family [Candidatus Levybacteria bacterium]|nr:type II toxin-antitoxin system mRNA interferase toxin, RelE/StbE family [Candidatus Levybacteria bacterium]
MIIELHPGFKKAYKKRVAQNPKLIALMSKRIKLFQNNPANKILKDHSLKGSKSKFRAFSITGDIRIVYLPISKERVIFLDVGTHNQVY